MLSARSLHKALLVSLVSKTPCRSLYYGRPSIIDASSSRSYRFMTPALMFSSIFAIGVYLADDEREHSFLLMSAAKTEMQSIATVTVDPSYLNEGLHYSSPTSASSTTILNWSGTHAVDVPNDRYFEPETLEEVERIVRECHLKGQPIRPLGAALSPNGIGFRSDGMMSLSNLNEVLNIDLDGPDGPTVTVEAGTRVREVIEAIRPYGLTLPNLASIAEQQMGGFVQVGAHGTGRKIAPVDHYVTSLKLVTPSKGTIILSEEDGDLFQLAKVGLGCLGVVVEVTMKCIPAHRLVEHTFVLTREQAKEQLGDLLTKHKHMRYMWIPYADAVVVVTNDPEDEVPDIPNLKQMSDEERFKPMTDLLIELTKDSPEPYTEDSAKGIGFGGIRDVLIALDPLDIDHVKHCNEAEAEFWRRSEGYQVKPSDELLQFDCGGQQWVWEVCFSTGTQDEDNGNDMLFMERLLEDIEVNDIPAHSPIEQRWTASSSSLMSPAHGPLNGLHSWVGIINYLPLDNEPQRRAITELFEGKYCDLMRDVGMPFNATSHWAKLELPKSFWKVIDLQLLMQSRFPIKLFNDARNVYDPKNILGNSKIDLVLGRAQK